MTPGYNSNYNNDSPLLYSSFAEGTPLSDISMLFSPSTFGISPKNENTNNNTLNSQMGIASGMNNNSNNHIELNSIEKTTPEDNHQSHNNITHSTGKL